MKKVVVIEDQPERFNDKGWSRIELLSGVLDKGKRAKVLALTAALFAIDLNRDAEDWIDICTTLREQGHTQQIERSIIGGLTDAKIVREWGFGGTIILYTENVIEGTEKKKIEKFIKDNNNVIFFDSLHKVMQYISNYYNEMDKQEREEFKRNIDMGEKIAGEIGIDYAVVLGFSQSNYENVKTTLLSEVNTAIAERVMALIEIHRIIWNAAYGGSADDRIHVWKSPRAELGGLSLFDKCETGKNEDIYDALNFCKEEGGV